MALLRAGQTKEGVAHLQEAIRLSPDVPAIAPWAVSMALGLAALGQTDMAEQTVRIALKHDETFFPAHLLAAHFCLTRGEPGEARSHMEQARKIRAATGAADIAHWCGPKAEDAFRAAGIL
jgi:Tfp pilus assembly protein PilF